jgi:hypothetical protein
VYWVAADAELVRQAKAIALAFRRSDEGAIWKEERETERKYKNKQNIAAKTTQQIQERTTAKFQNE